MPELRRIQVSGRMTSSEEDLLRILDKLCYFDSEEGGDGWALLDDLAESFFAGKQWTREVAASLISRGLVERRRSPQNMQWVEFAPSERGAAMLASGGSREVPHA